MFDLFGKIEEWFHDLLAGFISSNLTTMFTDVNAKTATIASEVGQTPQSWNGSIFSMIRNLSESVIVPIAGMIIAFVLCYELISMITERNNMHDIDTWMFFKWVFKSFVAVYLVTHTFDIVMGIFDVGQTLVSSAAGVIGANTSIDISSTISLRSFTRQNLFTLEIGIDHHHGRGIPIHITHDAGNGRQPGKAACIVPPMPCDNLILPISNRADNRRNKDANAADTFGKHPHLIIVSNLKRVISEGN